MIDDLTRQRCVNAVNDYGNERDWQKMRPDEIVDLVLKQLGLLPVFAQMTQLILDAMMDLVRDFAESGDPSIRAKAETVIEKYEQFKVYKATES